MSLKPNAKLGPYEILSSIGEGGMGQVYKARDTRLNRIVAIKVLPADKVADAERKQRFHQEARAASSLNHPNIVTIYDIGSENGIDYIAMEFVDGKTLDQLTPRNGMRIGDLLAAAIAVADALAKAHKAGIVHRDLKPHNVMVTTEGQVKVLDFGLAKLLQPGEGPGAGDGAGAAPGEDAGTKTMKDLTNDGTVLGTSYYMSPEQAEAKPVDGRSDIFSFGTMLYEMVTGQRPFFGQSQIAVLSAILREEPKGIAAIRPDAPNELIRVIARCLRKDPARRFQHMDDLKVALQELKEESDTGRLAGSSTTAAAVAAATSSRKKSIWIVAAALLLIAAAIAGWRIKTAGPAATPAPFQPIPLTSYRGIEYQPSFSPDGNQVALAWNGENEGNFDIYVKLIGPGSPLRLTSGQTSSFRPKWSRDGRSIAFVRSAPDQKYSVFVMPALGGPERRVGTYMTGPPPGGGYPMPSLCWTPDSKALIVSASPAPGQPNGLMLVSVETGETRPLTHPPADMRGDVHPALSPDGHSLAFIRTNGTLYDLWLLPLTDGFQPQGEPKQLRAGGLRVVSPEWMPDSRELLFVTASGSSTVYRLAVSPDAAPQILPGIGTGATAPSVSLQGYRLVYGSGTQDSNIWKVDLGTRSSALDTGLSSTFRDVFPQYSPDGKRVAFYSGRGGKQEIWIANEDGSQAVRLTSLGAPVTGSPRWSPDGQQIAFDSNAELAYHAYTISADGGQPRKLTKEESFSTNWSHDGRWIYFASKRVGDFQIWKMPSQGGDAVQLTHTGGIGPEESPDGKTLYFVRENGAGGIWKVPVEGGPETQVVPDVYRYSYAVTEKGIYFARAAGQGQSASIQFLSFATGTTTEVVKVGKPLDLGLTVSPDERTLLYAQIDSSGQNLILVENFH